MHCDIDYRLYPTDYTLLYIYMPHKESHPSYLTIKYKYNWIFTSRYLLYMDIELYKFIIMFFPGCSYTYLK